MYYLWCSHCHRQNSDSQRSAAGRRLLLEDGVLLHISEGEILAGSRWAACRDLWMFFFFPLLFLLLTYMHLNMWVEKKIYMDSITSPGKHASTILTVCLFAGHLLTWRTFFRLPSRWFAGNDTWSVNLLDRVVHFSSYLPCKTLRTLASHDLLKKMWLSVPCRQVVCGWWWWSGGERRWAGRNSHWNKVCVYSGGGKKRAEQKQASERHCSARLSGDGNIIMTCICQSVAHIHQGKNRAFTAGGRSFKPGDCVKSGRLEAGETFGSWNSLKYISHFFGRMFI